MFLERRGVPSLLLRTSISKAEFNAKIFRVLLMEF